ncbi:signal peptidase II [Gordonia tangerina]|uniref:Lipoprotein signal peptidase n=1 Tax=Gordonia tangerina TaxID=2911060 RepID=A0ABS9DQ90_9ACTN|nr:signal peptidase II [Gordonia tangerina]MCF3941389.1 signal peptidase II [Gordonia tangerina]
MTSHPHHRTDTTSPKPARRRRRILLVAVTSVLAAIAVAIDPIARTTLADNPVDLGPVQLRLAYNTGVAFSLGDRLPAGLLLTLTIAITLGLATYAWRNAPHQPKLHTISFAAIIAGATANVIDRLIDGKVTDYLHTGWWPTFNLADTYITCGTTLLIIAILLQHDTDHDQ